MAVGRVKPVLSDQVQQVILDQKGTRLLVGAAHRKGHTALRKARYDLMKGLFAGGVDVHHRFGIQHEPFDRRSGSRDTILNVFFKPILIILTLPVNILTLGLFTLVINAALLKIASALIPGFDVHGFWPAVLGAVIISVVNWLLGTLIADRGIPGNSGNSAMPGRGGPGAIDLEKRGDRWE